MNTIKSYNELIKLNSFDERFAYLLCGGHIGVETFGNNRYINQRFYSSSEWRNLRNYIIARDSGSDLGIIEYPIDSRRIYIHHINPITVSDIENNEAILDPNNLITTSRRTHDALHYGNLEYLKCNKIVEREPGDNKLWYI